MDRREFLDRLDEHPQLQFYVIENGEFGMPDGVMVGNTVFDTETHFSWDAIDRHEWDFLYHQTHQGKNIEQMTRVTGYYSKISLVNKGKRGEIRDRHRETEDSF